MKPEIIVMGSIYPPTLAHLDASCTVHRFWEAQDKKAFLAALAGHVDTAITSGGRGMTAEEMRALPGLKLIACFGVGVDAIDVGSATTLGIKVTNTPDVLTEDVADLALALLLAAVRRVAAGDRFVRTAAG